MKVTVERANVITFNAIAENEDKFFSNKYGTKCLHAKITFDLDNWKMSATSDVGEYSYEWIEDDRQTFLEYIIHYKKSYILSNIANRVFHIVETKERLLKMIEEDEDLTDEEEFRTIQKILNISENQSQYEFWQKLDEIDIMDKYDLQEVVVFDYPMNAQVFADLFVDELIPKIKEYLIEQERENI